MRWLPTRFLLGSASWHVAGALALGLSPRRWPLVAGALMANHTAIAAAGLWPRSRLLGPNLVRLPEAAAARGEVALTFDDGPDPEVTPRVLDLLDSWEPEGGPRATFFCIGRRVQRYPALTAEIQRRGHQVENHTWTHPNAFSCYPPAAVRREIAGAQEAIAAATGRRPAWFRAPAGFRSPVLEPELRLAGLRLASWTRRGYDTVSTRPEHIGRRLLRKLAAGDVLLLHDGSSARDGQGRPVVLEVLPRVLAALRSAGLVAATLGEPREERPAPSRRRA